MLVSHTGRLNTISKYERRYLFGVLVKHDTKVNTLFCIIAKLIRFVLIMAAFWNVLPYKTLDCSDVSEEQATYTTLGKT